MSVDDSDLLAYVDGCLPAKRRAEIEVAVANSSELAGRLAVMRASVLPYAVAFERESGPPLPQRLAEHVSDLVRVSTVSSRSAADFRPRTRTWLGAAAGILWVALICGGPLLFWARTETASISPWILAVASYQGLYARETVSSITADPVLAQRVLSDARSAGVSVSVPDLRSNGLEFKRVQRLTFNDQPVIQIVYLPEAGDPVALCVTRETGPPTAPRLQQLGPMHAAVWHDGTLGYVLIAKSTNVDILALGLRIADGAQRTLFSAPGGTG